MEFTIPIYKKDNKWYKTYTEVPDYDEKRFIEVYGFNKDMNLTLDELVNYVDRGWSKVASMGLHEWCVDNESIPMSDFIDEYKYNEIKRNMEIYS